MGTKHQTKRWRLAQTKRLRAHFEPAQRRRLELLRAFIKRQGWGAFSASITVDGINLGQWTTDRRRDYRNDKLPDWLAAALQSIPGWEWEPQRARHQRALDALRAHVERTGALPRPGQAIVDDIDLSVWIKGRRKTHRAGTVQPWLRDELDAIDAWTWKGRRTRFPKSPTKRERRQEQRVDTEARTRRRKPKPKPKRRRDPRALFEAAAKKLGIPAAVIVCDLAQLAGWVDSIGAATRARLPSAVRAAANAESRHRKNTDRDTDI